MVREGREAGPLLVGFVIGGQMDPVAQELPLLQALALRNPVVVDEPLLLALRKAVLKKKKAVSDTRAGLLSSAWKNGTAMVVARLRPFNAP